MNWFPFLFSTFFFPSIWLFGHRSFIIFVLHLLCPLEVGQTQCFGGVVQLGGRDYPLFSKLLFSHYYIHVYIYIYIYICTHTDKCDFFFVFCLFFLFSSCFLSFALFFFLLLLLVLAFISNIVLVAVAAVLSSIYWTMTIYLVCVCHPIIYIM